MGKEMNCLTVQKSTVCFISFNVREVWDVEGTIPCLFSHPYFYIL